MFNNFWFSTSIYAVLKILIGFGLFYLIKYDYPDGTFLKANQEYCLYCFLVCLILGLIINLICAYIKCRHLYGEAVHTLTAFFWVVVYLTVMYVIDPVSIHEKTPLADETFLDDPIPGNKIPADDDARKGPYRLIILLLSLLVLIVQSCLLKLLYHIYDLYGRRREETVMLPPGNENVLNPVYDPPPTYNSAVNLENERDPAETPPPLYDDLPRDMCLSKISQDSDDISENEPPTPPNSPATPPPYVNRSKKNYQGSSTPPSSLSTDREEHSNRQLPQSKSESSQSTDKEEEHAEMHLSTHQKKRSNTRPSGSKKSPRSPPKPSPSTMILRDRKSRGSVYSQ